MARRLLIYCAVLLVIGCHDSRNETPFGLSSNAQNYLDEVYNIMNKNSINRAQIDWTDFKKQMYQSATG